MVHCESGSMVEDELAQANSEMRFLTLELMKIAVRRKVRFREVVGEFIENVFYLERTVKRRTLRRSRRKAKRLARRLVGHRFVEPRPR